MKSMQEVAQQIIDDFEKEEDIDEMMQETLDHNLALMGFCAVYNQSDDCFIAVPCHPSMTANAWVATHKGK